MMTGKKTKKKTVKKVKDTTDIGVLEPEIVEKKPEKQADARGLTEVSKTGAFVPTNKMIKWLDYSIQNPNDTNAEIARKTNIAEQSLYRWRENLDFLRWYKAEWDKRLVQYGPKLDVIGLKNSADNYKYWQAMQQRVGNLEQQAVKLQNNIQMNVNFLEDDGKAVEESS